MNRTHGGKGIRWMRLQILTWVTVVILGGLSPLMALERTNSVFKIFQFPPDKIPRIDGDKSDWDMVPQDYAIGMNELADTTGGKGTNHARLDLDVMVKVGWVKDLNQLFFLYEAYDDYWDFSRSDLHNDIFELVVDGDLSGGPFIKHMHPQLKESDPRAHFEFHGVHAQNYHIFTPYKDKEWTMVWGCQPWIKHLPYANAAQKFDFKPGESGRYILEFWITPFDFAPSEGPSRSIVSKLKEEAIVGLSWAILDYDDVNSPRNKAFWNLSHKTTMYGNASDLCAFKLMPLESQFRPPIQAEWSFEVLDLEAGLVSFKDRSKGGITSWKWEFGDGTSSTEQNPSHRYLKRGEQTVTLRVEGKGGESKLSKVWDLFLPEKSQSTSR